MSVENNFQFTDKYTYIILPGLSNSGSEHWQTFWEKKYGWEKIDFIEWENPVFEKWKEILDKKIEQSTKPVILIAHSLACILVASLNDEKYKSKIAGALLVAPPDIENTEGLPESLKSFMPIPLEYLPYPSLVVYSEDDRFAAVERSFYFCLSWRSYAHTVGEAGHINVETGFGQWEDGIKLFYEWMQQTKLI